MGKQWIGKQMCLTYIRIKIRNIIQLTMAPNFADNPLLKLPAVF